MGALLKMAHGIQIFQIQLNKPSYTYAPGETLSGQVIIRLYKVKCVRALKLKIKGVCDVNENVTDVARTSYNSIMAKETYFDIDVILCGGDEQIAQIGAGDNSFPFCFLLPNSIPSSFEHKIGKVRYTIRAVMDRPWKYNHETEILFRVETPFKLNPESMIEIDDSDGRNVCKILPCINDGYIRFRFRVSKNNFTRGENIIFKANFVNKSSSVRIREIALSLIQKITFHNHAPFKNKRVETNVIQRVAKSGPFPHVSEEILEILVPSLPYSNLQYCKFIDIDYKLQVNVSVSGCNFKMKKMYEIFIGSDDREITCIEGEDVPDSLSLHPTMPFAVQNIENIGYISANTGNPEDSPPSYESVMAYAAQKNNEQIN